MRYSKSILIFLFLSSTTSEFYYALDRTDGNLGQSIMFTMYFLAIKIGLIGPIITDGFEPPQLTHHVWLRLEFYLAIPRRMAIMLVLRGIVR